MSIRTLLRDSRKEDGFSLTELVIVIVIVGILAAIAIPIYANSQREAAIATLKSDVNSTVSSLSTWKASQGQFDPRLLVQYSNNLATNFTPRVAVVSDVRNVISYRLYQDPQDESRIAFCVQGQRNFGGGNIVTWHYNELSDQLVNAVCPASLGFLTPELLN